MDDVINDNGTLKIVCQWFARCTNGTLEAAPHPILGHVPCCDRCRRMAEIPQSSMADIELKF